MWKAIALSICAAFLLRSPSHAADLTALVPTLATPTPDFEALRIQGLTVALPGPQDTIDPAFAGIRSSLAAVGIGYIGYTNNNFFDNMLPAERTTLGQQVYSGQKPTFFTNNVMQMTYDLSRFGISDGQIVVGGIYNFDTWEPAGPNALSLATLSYYQTFLNRQVELKVGYLANVVEYWGPFLAGNLSSSIFGPSGLIPVQAGLSAWAWTKPAINIKVNGPDGLYNKFGVQVASNPDGPFAEKTGNIRRLTRWVLASGIAQAQEWAARGHDLRVAVNLSARDLDDADLPRRVGDLLSLHGVSPRSIVLELTESAVMGEPELAVQVLRGLSDMGIDLAIDDFGVGQSSFAYLRRLPVREIKIDRLFTQRLAEDVGDRTLVRSIVDLGHRLGYRVTAEGVETRAAIEYLRSIGCDHAQGFYIAHALAPDAVESLFTRNDWDVTRAGAGT